MNEVAQVANRNVYERTNDLRRMFTGGQISKATGRYKLEATLRLLEALKAKE